MKRFHDVIRRSPIPIRVLCFLSFLLVCLLVPGPKLEVLDSRTRLPAEGFTWVKPGVATLFEPFVGPAKHLHFSLYDIQAQLLSLLEWMLLAALLFGLLSALLSKRSWLGKLWLWVQCTTLIPFSFFLFLIYAMWFPLPAFKLVSPDQDVVLFDPQSHTIYSHDGLASPERSVVYHVSHGFDAWFITEHNHIKGVEPVKKLVKQQHPEKTIIAGEEVRNASVGMDGSYLVVYGLSKPLDPGYFAHDAVRMIQHVKEEQHGAVGVCLCDLDPEKVNNLVKAGVDAFEVSNGGHMDEPPEAIQATIDACQQEGLCALSATDWHGWRRYTCIAWSAVRIPDWSSIQDQDERSRLLVNLIRERQSERFVPLLLGRREPLNRTRYKFEPFFCLYAYFTGARPMDILSWAIWGSLVLWGIPKLGRRSKGALLGLVYLFAGVFCWYRAISWVLFDFSRVAGDNNILPGLSLNIALVGTVSLLVGVVFLMRASIRR